MFYPTILRVVRARPYSGELALEEAINQQQDRQRSESEVGAWDWWC